jgi:tetratricopeptide (TPR) repeat protein
MLNFQVTSDDDMTAQQLFEMGLKKETAGLYQEAVDYYLKATKKDPNFKQAWGRLGRVYFDRSLEAYRKILEMDPSNTKLREWLSHYNQ